MRRLSGFAQGTVGGGAGLARAGVAATAVLMAAVTAGCSNTLSEPMMEQNSVASSSPSAAESSSSSAADSSFHSSEPSSAQSTVTETMTETITKPNAGDGGANYSQVKNSDGYFINVGLGEAGKEASFPACDGRYILIVDSIIDEAGDSDTFHRLAVAALTASTPAREYTVPGRCASLRKKVDGNVIYPVYLDFGTDKSAMCAAKSRYSGNGRTLNNSGDFTDPCE